MSHGTCMQESCYSYEWVMSHIWMSHVTHMNESRHTYERVMSHIWMSHVTHMNESCHTYEWVMSHICAGDICDFVKAHIQTNLNASISHIPLQTNHVSWYDCIARQMDAPCRIYDRVTSHEWTSHVTRVNKSRHTHKWVTSHLKKTQIRQKRPTKMRQKRDQYDSFCDGVPSWMCCIWFKRGLHLHKQM